MKRLALGIMAAAALLSIPGLPAMSQAPSRLIVAATPIFSPSAGGRQPCPAVHWGTLAGAIDQGRISASEKAGSAKPGFAILRAPFWRCLRDIHVCDATLKLL